MKHKLIYFLVLGILSPLQLFSQTTANPDTVCAGSNVYYKIQNANSNSTFEWGIYNNQGSINSGMGTDSIRIAWNNTSGTDSIWVVETNQAGCTGDTSRLKIVRVAPPNATFDNSSLCFGENLNINFTGYPPWQVQYTLNGNTVTQTGITQNSYSLNKAGNYTLLQVSDKHCTNSSPSGTVNAFIAQPLQELQIFHE